MASQPGTPFIPPLLSANNSPNPQPAPVIPGPGGNTGNNYPGYFTTGGGYPAYSPHSSAVPFIPPSPNAGASPFIPPTPGLPPGANPAGGAQPPRGHARGAPSHDFGAYPPGGPSPYMQQTPHLQPSMGYFGQYTPYGPMGPQIYSPYQPPHSAPAFGMAPPFAPPGVPMSSPYGPPPGGVPPMGWGVPNPYATPIPPPAAQMGWGPIPNTAPPMQRGQSQGGGPQDQWFGANPGRRGPEPPPQIHDRMERFTPGAHYYPVLDPFIVKVVQARISINPLIAMIPEDGSNQPHLDWNMLFPTANVHRSDTPKHLSWSNGRDAPATFPRVTSLRLVSEAYPWIIEVRGKDKDYGVTCGEVIEAIGYDMGKMSHQQDFNNLTPRERNELSAAYRMNRSREDGAPGGALGEGLKRLDFLRRSTIFGGIEVNDHIVKRKCGDVLPCVFVLHCLRSYPMSKQDIRDNEMRARSAAAQASEGRRTPGPGVRPRANSNVGPGIRVESPTTTSDSDDGGFDR